MEGSPFASLVCTSAYFESVVTTTFEMARELFEPTAGSGMFAIVILSAVQLFGAAVVVDEAALAVVVVRGRVVEVDDADPDSDFDDEPPQAPMSRADASTAPAKATFRELMEPNMTSPP